MIFQRYTYYVIISKIVKEFKTQVCIIRETQKEMSHVSKSFVPHRQKGSIVSLKLCWNLCRRSRVNNFNPRGLWTLHINAGLGRINLSSACLKISMEEEFWMFWVKLVPTKEWMRGNVDLKHSVLMKGTFGEWTIIMSDFIIKNIFSCTTFYH